MTKIQEMKKRLIFFLHAGKKFKRFEWPCLKRVTMWHPPCVINNNGDDETEGRPLGLTDLARKEKEKQTDKDKNKERSLTQTID